MNFDQLNRWLTLVANIGVIAGIVFLAYELRQNNELMAAEYRATSLAQRTTFMEKGTDPGIAELFVRISQGERLLPADLGRVELIYEWFLEMWEWTYDESVYGVTELPDENELPQWRESYRNFPGLDQYWQEKKKFAPPGFRQWMDENIATE